MTIASTGCNAPIDEIGDVAARIPVMIGERAKRHDLAAGVFERPAKSTRIADAAHAATSLPGANQLPLGAFVLNPCQRLMHRPHDRRVGDFVTNSTNDVLNVGVRNLIRAQ